jgi:hypothetical protein
MAEVAEPIPIARALTRVAEKAALTDYSEQAEDAAPESKERRREQAATLQERMSMRKVARNMGIAELKELEPSLRGDALAVVTRAAAIDLGLRLLAGEFPFKDAAQAAHVLKVLTEITRLESGQATTITESSDAMVLQREFAELRAKVAERVAAAGPPIADAEIVDG